MKRQISFRRLLLFAAFILLCNFFNPSYSQVQTARYVSMGPNTNGYYEYLPVGYNQASIQAYPLIVFVHGVGEAGDGSPLQLPKMLNAGLPGTINWGLFPQTFTVNGQTNSFIVISPQFINYPTPGDVDITISYAISHYHVNTSRVYLTGLSMGGGTVWEYAGFGSPYTDRLAAIVPFAGASYPDLGRSRNIAAANLPVWAFHNEFDVTVPVWNTDTYVAQINEFPSPNPLAKETVFPVGGHNAWTNVYNSQYSENGMTMFQWMLQYQKGLGLLPVSILQFTAQKSGSNIDLNWNASTTGIGGNFLIEKSPDGRNFQQIGSIDISRNSGTFNYSFSDHAPSIGKNFYRIKIAENNAVFKYSPIVSVDLASKALYSIYPTATSSLIFITIPKPSLISIFNAQGVLIKKLELQASQNIEVSDLSNGIYQVQFNGKETIRFIKL